MTDDLDGRHDHVRRTILIEQFAPQPTARPASLRGVEDQRIEPAAGRTDIIDRAATRPEARPGLLPFGAMLKALRVPSCDTVRGPAARRQIA